MEIIRKENTIFLLLLVILASHLFHQPVITNISMGLLGIVSLLSQDMPKRLLKAIKTPLFWSSIAFFLVYAISLSYSDNLKEGTRSITAKLPLLVFPIMFAMLPITKKLILRVIKSFPLLLLLSLTTSLIIQYFKANQADDISLIYSDNLGSPFGIQAVYNGLFINMALIFCFYLISIAKEKKEKILFISTGITLFAFHLLLISRIAFLMAILILIMGSLIILLKQASKQVQLISILVLMALPFLAYFSSEKLQNRFNSISNTEYRFDNPNPLNHYNAEQSDDNWNSITARLATWSCAKDVFFKSPVIGHGVGDHFDELIKVYEEKNFILGLKEQYNTHNQYIDISIATGIIGLICLLFYFIFPVILSMKEKTYLPIAIALLIAFSALTENVLNRSQGIIIIAVLYSLINTQFYIKSQTKIK